MLHYTTVFYTIIGLFIFVRILFSEIFCYHNRWYMCYSKRRNWLHTCIWLHAVYARCSLAEWLARLL